MGRPRKSVENQSEQPEVIEEGIDQMDEVKNPMVDNQTGKKPRIKGNWKKVTEKELIELESSGLLVGYDPDSGEALVK